MIGGLGGFGGLFRLNELTYTNVNNESKSYKDPVLVERTSGVGVKLKIAIESEIYDTIGVDLVAACANSVLSTGAQPFAFLDYVACGKLFVPVVAEMIKGIAEGCRASNSALLGMNLQRTNSTFSNHKVNMYYYLIFRIKFCRWRNS